MVEEPRKLSDKSERLRAAARGDDGFFSTFILRKISIRITSLLVETNVRPNTITYLSLIIGLLAASTVSQGAYVAGGIFLLFSLVLDCIDGEIARYKNEFSPLGAWLDALSDRIKEFAYIFSLSFSAHDKRVFLLAIYLVILQNIRHLSDYNFSRYQKFIDNNSNKNLKVGILYWLKKIANLPIAERWLLLALLPSLLPMNQALIMILSISILSLFYVFLARARRVLKWPKSSMSANFLRDQSDTFLPLSFTGNRISWLYPSILRALEFFALMIITSDASLPTRLYLVISVALWHYSNLYDALQGRSVYLGLAGLHVAGRIGLCFVGQFLDLQSTILILLSSYLLLIIFIRGWHNVTRGSR